MRLSPGIRYDPVLFVASILIAIGAATAALWIAFHLAKQRAVFTNFGAALVMGAAVVGMHFTAVAAAKFDPEFDLPRRRAEARRGVDGLHHRRVHVRHPDRDHAAFGVRRAPLLGHRRRRGEAAAGERAARAARARAHPDLQQKRQDRSCARARLHRLDGCPRPHRGMESGGGAHLRLYAPGSARPRARRAGDRPRSLPGDERAAGDRPAHRATGVRRSGEPFPVEVAIT